MLEWLDQTIGNGRSCTSLPRRRRRGSGAVHAKAAPRPQHGPRWTSRWPHGGRTCCRWCCPQPSPLEGLTCPLLCCYVGLTCTGLVCYCVGIGEYCCCGFNMIHVFSVAGPTCQDEACQGRAAPRNRGRRRGCPEGCRQGCMQLLREALRLRLGLPELVLGPLRLRTERSAPRSGLDEFLVLVI